MSAASPSTETVELIELMGRIMWCHRLDPAYAGRVLDVSHTEAASLIAGADAKTVAGSLTPIAAARLPLFVSVLLRLEHVCRHDSRTIRRVIDAPLASLGNRSPAELLGGGLDELTMLRRAVSEVDVPPTKWWRVGH